MAIIKHIPVKNRYYSAAVEYLTCKFDEHTMKPLEDAKGRMIMRYKVILIYVQKVLNKNVHML